MKLKVYHDPGIISYRGDKSSKSMEYLGQLSKEIKYVGKYKFVSYIRKTYGLSAEQYYNLVVEGDINAEHYCMNEGCSNKVHFKSLLDPYYKFGLTREENIII